MEDNIIYQYLMKGLSNGTKTLDELERGIQAYEWAQGQGLRDGNDEHYQVQKAARDAWKQIQSPSQA